MKDRQNSDFVTLNSDFLLIPQGCRSMLSETDSTLSDQVSEQRRERDRERERERDAPQRYK